MLHDPKRLEFKSCKMQLKLEYRSVRMLCITVDGVTGDGTQRLIGRSGGIRIPSGIGAKEIRICKNACLKEGRYGGSRGVGANVQVQSEKGQEMCCFGGM